MSIIKNLEKVNFRTEACKDLIGALIRHEKEFEVRNKGHYARSIIIGLTDVFPEDAKAIQVVFEAERKANMPTINKVEMEVVNVGIDESEYGKNDDDCAGCEEKKVIDSTGKERTLNLSDCKNHEDLKLYFDNDIERAKVACKEIGINLGNTKAEDKIYDKILAYLEEDAED